MMNLEPMLIVSPAMVYRAKKFMKERVTIEDCENEITRLGSIIDEIQGTRIYKILHYLKLL